MFLTYFHVENSSEISDRIYLFNVQEFYLEFTLVLCFFSILFYISVLLNSRTNIYLTSCSSSFRHDSFTFLLQILKEIFFLFSPQLTPAYLAWLIWFPNYSRCWIPLSGVFVAEHLRTANVFFETRTVLLLRLWLYDIIVFFFSSYFKRCSMLFRFIWFIF